MMNMPPIGNSWSYGGFTCGYNGRTLYKTLQITATYLSGQPLTVYATGLSTPDGFSWAMRPDLISSK